MHIPYESNLGRKHDFRVKYRFYTQEEGGRQTLPSQGYRSDFWYENESYPNNHLFIIHPEFEDSNGNVILEENLSVLDKGTARMFIANPQWKDFHKQNIKLEMKGHFMEGDRKVAECHVIEILM